MPQIPSKSEIEEVLKALRSLLRKEGNGYNATKYAFLLGAELGILWRSGEIPRNDIVTDAELKEALGYVPK